MIAAYLTILVTMLTFLTSESFFLCSLYLLILNLRKSSIICLTTGLEWYCLELLRCAILDKTVKFWNIPYLFRLFV